MKTRSSIRQMHPTRILVSSVALGASLVFVPAFAASSTPGEAGPRTTTGATDSRSSANPSGSQDMRPSGSATSSTAAAGDVASRDRDFLQKAAKNSMTEIQASQAAITRAQNEQVKEYAQRIIADHQRSNTQLASIAAQKGVNVALGSGGLGAASGSMARTDSPGSSAYPTGAPGTASGTGGSARTGERPATDATSTSTGSVADSTDARSSGAGSVGAGGAASASTSSRTAAKEMLPDDDKLHNLLGKSGAEFDRAYLDHMVDGHREAISLFESAERSQDASIKQFASSQLPTLRQHLQQAQSLQRTARESGAGARSGASGSSGARPSNP